jgi:hypothetical protein
MMTLKGLLLTLMIIFTCGVTNGGFAVWTLEELMTFAVPALLAKLTIPQILSSIAFYK